MVQALCEWPLASAHNQDLAAPLLHNSRGYGEFGTAFVQVGCVSSRRGTRELATVPVNLIDRLSVPASDER